MPLASVRFELKAGTSDSRASPGTAIFDNFRPGSLDTGAGASEIVVYAADVAASQGVWQHVSHASAAGGIKLATQRLSAPSTAC